MFNKFSKLDDTGIRADEPWNTAPIVLTSAYYCYRAHRLDLCYSTINIKFMKPVVESGMDTPPSACFSSLVWPLQFVVHLESW